MLGLRQKLLEQLKHAFAIPENSSPPTERQRQIVRLVCREVVRRRLTTPALAFLEMSQPLNFLGAQAMHFFHPLLSAISDSSLPAEFAQFLERRDSLEILAKEIEAQERIASTRDQQQ